MAGDVTKAQIESLSMKWFGPIPAQAKKNIIIPKEQPQAEKEALWNNFASATFPKKKTRKKQGHRQELTRILIERININ